MPEMASEMSFFLVDRFDVVAFHHPEDGGELLQFFER